MSNGELSQEEAQKQAMEVIKNIRYGDTSSDYFWINDMYPNIMHPLRPDLDGQD
ncbi:cache domain-containing protein [Anaerobacillus sp. HL2]|nr:cache domain-containing protein [Anaerobacillus sp. HL2]